MKNDYLHMRISKCEKRELARDAKRAGFGSVSQFLIWLWKNRRARSERHG